MTLLSRQCTEITIHDYCKIVDENFVSRHTWNNESRCKYIYMCFTKLLMVKTKGGV